jgi:hypothetical protein
LANRPEQQNRSGGLFYRGDPLVDDLFQNIQGQAAMVQHDLVEFSDVELVA